MMRVESAIAFPSSTSTGTDFCPVIQRTRGTWSPGRSERRTCGMPFQSSAQRAFSLECETRNCQRTGRSATAGREPVKARLPPAAMPVPGARVGEALVRHDDLRGVAEVVELDRHQRLPHLPHDAVPAPGIDRHFPDGRGPSVSLGVETALVTSRARVFCCRGARHGSPGGLRAPAGLTAAPGGRTPGAARPPAALRDTLRASKWGRLWWPQPRDPSEEAAEQLTRHRHL